jgi:hypothetical protein
MPSSIDIGGDQDDEAGSELTNAFPCESTATHGPSGAHETASNGAPVWSTSALLQDGLGAVGSVVVSALPCASTATHSASEAHDTALGVLGDGSAAGVDQVSDGVA